MHGKIWVRCRPRKLLSTRMGGRQMWKYVNESVLRLHLCSYTHILGESPSHLLVAMETLPVYT